MALAEEAAAPNEYEPALLKLSGARVLVVDDDWDTRYLVERVLADAGMMVAGAESVAQAFELLVSFRPSVIISDIEMPIENGYSFLRNLRSVLDEDGGNTLAIALTARTLPEDRKRALAAGFNLHLCKPTTREAILEALVYLLLGHRPSSSA